MKIAMIIVNYNDIKSTIEYVNKIKNYKIIDRIVVVDNHSSVENAMKKLDSLNNEKTSVIQTEKNGGYSYGNNFGIKYLEKNNEKFDYIIISNPDIDVEEKAIEESINVLKSDDKYAITAPRMHNLKDVPSRRSSWKLRTFGRDVVHSTRLLELIFYKILRSGEYSENDYMNSTLEVEAISGAFFVIKYDVLKQIGMFDENVFLFYEEDIIGKKIKDLGLKIISINDIKFVHYESKTIGKTFSYYEKVKQLYKSKMYYQENFNKINTIQKIIFMILYLFRNIELVIEIPVRKLLKK